MIIAAKRLLSLILSFSFSLNVEERGDMCLKGLKVFLGLLAHDPVEYTYTCIIGMELHEGLHVQMYYMFLASLHISHLCGPLQENREKLSLDPQWTDENGDVKLWSFIKLLSLLTTCPFLAGQKSFGSNYLGGSL
jgi:hypothetical protein